MGELLSVDPLTLFVFIAAGGLIVYVVRIFTQAQTIREREMWAAMQAMSDDSRATNNDWLKTYKEQGDKSSDSIQSLSNNVATLTTQVAHLAAAVEKSNEKGATLQGASDLMVKALQEAGNGRSVVK